MSKKVFVVFLAYLILNTALCNAGQKIVLKIFHAGSLCMPFSRMEADFEKKYPHVDLRREASGSVKAVRKITELHKSCDVVAVADYSLVPQMLFPKYADHVKLFARNELVLCYTQKSRYANQINQHNWYQILMHPQVKWGFSNPNDDPCGYRTVISIGLSALHYKKFELINKLLGQFTNLNWQKTEEGFYFIVPSNFKTNRHKVVIRHKSVELLGLLESGAIDYAFEYKSVALQHNLLFVSLPAEINLGNLKQANFYKKVHIKLANGKVIQGKPIVYGIATLKTSAHPKEAKLWEDFVTGEEGKRILQDCFQIPISPAQEIKTMPLTQKIVTKYK